MSQGFRRLEDFAPAPCPTEPATILPCASGHWAPAGTAAAAASNEDRALTRTGFEPGTSTENTRRGLDGGEASVGLDSTRVTADSDSELGNANPAGNRASRAAGT